MTYFRDLTPYNYGAVDCSDLDVRNIGWLAGGDNFPTASPDPQFIEKLWRLCKVSVGQSRGLHACEICRSHEANVARRENEKLLLGSAEIRVLSDQAQIYAAPNLIYHYVVDHNYSPPSEFVHAVLVGPCPPDNCYFEELSKRGICWSDTLVPEGGGKAFRFVKTLEGIARIEE